MIKVEIKRKEDNSEKNLIISDERNGQYRAAIFYITIETTQREIVDLINEGILNLENFYENRK